MPAYPNIGKVTPWVDNSFFQALSHTFYEAGIVISFSHHALLGGFSATDAAHETAWLHDGRTLCTTSAQLYAPLRRYID